MTTPIHPRPMHPRIVCFPDGFAEGCGTWFTPDQNAAALPEGVAYVPEVRVVPEDVAKMMEGVTDAPWQQGEMVDGAVFNWWLPPDHPEAMVCDNATPANARFIAWAREAVPALAARLAEVETAERDLSASYLRIRTILNAFDTNHGGENRFEVTEKALADLIANLSASEAREVKLRAALHDAINAPKGVVPKSAEPFYSADRAALQDTAPIGDSHEC